MIIKVSEMEAFCYDKRIKTKLHLIILLFVTLANFIAQVPYYLHQYHSPPSVTGSLLLLIVLVWFLVGFLWLWQRKMKGYVVTMAFLVVEFLFYLSTQFTQALSGQGVLLHVIHPTDAVLFIVFGIGYINMLTAGVYSFYLLFHKSTLVMSSAGNQDDN